MPRKYSKHFNQFFVCEISFFNVLHFCCCCCFMNCQETIPESKTSVHGHVAAQNNKNQKNSN